MKTILAAAAALLISAQALATDKDHGQPVTPAPEIARGDQGFSRNGYKEHFAVSALAGIAVTHFERDSTLKAWSYAMVPGLVKEIIDSQQRGNHFSGRDMLANALGAAVGVGLGKTMIMMTSGGKTTVALLIEN